MNKLKNKFNFNNYKNIFIIILIILIIIIIYFNYKKIEKYENENEDNTLVPNYLFIYGKNKESTKDLEELKKLYKDEYKESTMNIKVLEKDIKNMDSNYLNKMDQ